MNIVLVQGRPDFSLGRPNFLYNETVIFYIYILKCADGTLYTGYTNDLEGRLKDHNGNGKKFGAKYTVGRRPVKLVHSESFKTKSEAMKRECEIKKLSRSKKEQLIKNVQRSAS